MKTLRFKNQQGFTIVELLVAMTLFVVVISIAITTFLSALKTQRAIVALVSINDNAGLFIEQMAREVRRGRNFSNPTDSILRFTSGRGEAVTYQLTDGRIERQVDNGLFVAQTASNVKIEDARFVVIDHDGDIAVWPRVTLSLRVASKSPELDNVYTDIQTTISPRVLSQD
jgi:prepilin-type N-terminal cleavage/methylation domain-containing protein